MKKVTPFVGVWIEISQSSRMQNPYVVTPFVGVWIETDRRLNFAYLVHMSHPSWVCGLKLDAQGLELPELDVTPFVGVWIETQMN